MLSLPQRNWSLPSASLRLISTVTWKMVWDRLLLMFIAVAPVTRCAAPRSMSWARNRRVQGDARQGSVPRVPHRSPDLHHVVHIADHDGGEVLDVHPARPLFQVESLPQVAAE